MVSLSVRSSVLFCLSGLALLDLVAAAKSDGCGKNLPAGVKAGGHNSTQIDIESGGLNRTYRVHVPENYDKDAPTPLIFSFHGRSKTAVEQELLSMFSNKTYNPNAIAIYPNGVPNSKGTQQWEGDPDAPSDIDDVQFTLDMLDDIQSKYCIDTNTIYAAGKSNGGGFTNILACDTRTTNLFAAYAPVSAAIYLKSDNSTPPNCNTTRSPVPIIDFHGWEDTTADYLGGPNTRGSAYTYAVPAWLNAWAERDGIDANDNTTSVFCGRGKRAVLKHVWEKEGWGEVLIHYNISNLAHDWPSTYPNDDGNNTTCFDATTEIMKFFDKWALW